ncbi:MAG: 50S ribosomal protein L13 [Bacillota bacterium]|nr:50S ribosomal protein L13 [Bacillota bacterium]
MKTYMAKPGEIAHKWYIVDASGKVLGRMCSCVAAVLRGKNKPTFTPHVDTGDNVIIINAEKAVFTGKKLDQKKYRYHTGYAGHLKEISYRDLMAKRPEFAVYLAIRGMLPGNTLGRQMLRKLRVYRGGEHPHTAQVPETLEI